MSYLNPLPRGLIVPWHGLRADDTGPVTPAYAR